MLRAGSPLPPPPDRRGIVAASSTPTTPMWVLACRSRVQRGLGITKVRISVPLWIPGLLGRRFLTHRLIGGLEMHLTEFLHPFLPQLLEQSGGHLLGLRPRSLGDRNDQPFLELLHLISHVAGNHRSGRRHKGRIQPWFSFANRNPPLRHIFAPGLWKTSIKKTPISGFSGPGRH